MNKRQLLALAVVPALLAACGGGDDGFTDRADIADPKVRLVHAIPGGPNISLLRGNLALGSEVTDMAYKGASNYFDTDRSPHFWEVRTATTPSVSVGSHTFETHVGNRYTMVAVPDVGSLTSVVLIGDPYNKSITSDDARVRVFNAASNTAGVDLYLTGPAVSITNLAPQLAGAGYKQAVPASGADSFDLEGGTYSLRLTTAGTKTVIFTALVSIPANADWLLVPIPASATPGDVRVLVIQSGFGPPSTELVNQP